MCTNYIIKKWRPFRVIKKAMRKEVDFIFYRAADITDM